MCELPQAFQTKQRRARKEHKCCECGQTINKGDLYQYSSGIWDGEPSSYKQCFSCNVISQAVLVHPAYETDFNDGLAFGELREFFFGYLCTGFNGQKALNSFAKDLGFEPRFLNKLLNLGKD